MAGTNAISRHLAGRLAGGGGRASYDTLSTVLGFIAVTVRDHQHGRRLPDHRPHAADVQEGASRERDAVSDRPRWTASASATSSRRSASSWACGASPRRSTRRRGILLGEIGMLVAVVGTLVLNEIIDYEWIAVGLIIGSAHRRRDVGVDPDDEDAGADRALARVRRPRGGAGRASPSTTTDACTRRSARPLHDGRARLRGVPRLRSPSPAA